MIPTPKSILTQSSTVRSKLKQVNSQLHFLITNGESQLNLAKEFPDHSDSIWWQRGFPQVEELKRRIAEYKLMQADIEEAVKCFDKATDRLLRL